MPKSRGGEEQRSTPRRNTSQQIVLESVGLSALARLAVGGPQRVHVERRRRKDETPRPMASARPKRRARPVACHPSVRPLDRLVLEMLPFVHSFAARIKRKLPRHIERDDLVSAGLIGVLDALRRFDAGKEVTFAVYARGRIQGAILDEVRSMDHASRHMRSKNKRIEQTRQAMELRVGRAVSESELARELGMTVEQWHRTNWHLGAIRTPTKPSSDVDPDGDGGLDLLAASDSDPFDQCYQSELGEILERARAILPIRHRTILADYYYRSIPFKKIAEKLGLHPSRVSQLHAEALHLMRPFVLQEMRGPHP